MAVIDTGASHMGHPETAPRLCLVVILLLARIQDLLNAETNLDAHGSEADDQVSAVPLLATGDSTLELHTLSCHLTPCKHTGRTQVFSQAIHFKGWPHIG